MKKILTIAIFTAMMASALMFTWSCSSSSSSTFPQSMTSVISYYPSPTP